MRQAFGCYRQAAELGDAWAQYNLGHLYLDGNGVDRDPLLASHWYAAAAAQGHPRAMNLLARCYEEGWGVARDSTLAEYWYEKSAEGGYFRGQYNWATILVRMNRVEEAVVWLARAATAATPAVRQAIVAFSKRIDHVYPIDFSAFCKSLCNSAWCDRRRRRGCATLCA
ncbi:MAG: tetratricopeptide repeat protein [Rudaea sp.]|nr:tetratricopeptide repeat protein [Rudaea sp.]